MTQRGVGADRKLQLRDREDENRKRNRAVRSFVFEQVTGAAKARVAFWFSGLGRQTFAFSQAVAGATQLDLLGVDYDATPVRAAVVADAVVIDLQLAPRTAARRP